MPNDASNHMHTPRVSIDFTLPLWGVLTSVVGGFIMLVGLFFNVAALTANIKDLQITVQAGNTAYSTLASRTTLLEFRVDNHAAEIKHIKSKAEK